MPRGFGNMQNKTLMPTKPPCPAGRKKVKKSLPFIARKNHYFVWIFARYFVWILAIYRKEKSRFWEILAIYRKEFLAILGIYRKEKSQGNH